MSPLALCVKPVSF